MSQNNNQSGSEQLSLILPEIDTPVTKAGLTDDVFVCLDIETTGFNTDTDSVIEIAAVKFNIKGEELGRFNTLIFTETEIPIIVQDLTGIKNEMLLGQPVLESVKNDLTNFVKDHPIIGHNINFDLNFLSSKGIHLPGLRIDTFPISQILVKHCLSYSLETLSHHFSNHQPSHRALDDVLANIELFLYLLELWKKYQTPLSQKILEKSDLPFKDCLLMVNPDPNWQLSKPELLAPTPENVLTNEGIELIKSKPSSTLIITTDDQSAELISKGLVTEVTPYYQIVDPEKFTQLCDKETLSESEGLAALKLCCNQTENGLPTINTLNLHGPDYSVAASLVYTTPQALPKLADSNRPLNLTHSYFFHLLANSSLDLKSYPVLFFEDPTLEETFVRATTKSLVNQDFNTPGSDMAFGLLGIFWNKYQQDPLSNLLILIDSHFTSEEWQKAQVAFQKLNIDLPNPSENFIWLNKKSDRPPIIQFLPKTAVYSSERLAKDYDLNIEIVPFSFTVNQKILIHSPIPQPNEYNYNQAVLDEISNLISQSNQDLCILTTSHDHIKAIYKHCLSNFPNRNIIAQKLSGSAGKLQHKMTEQAGANILICTYQYYIRHKPPLNNLDHLIMARLPIMTPNHPYYTFHEQTDKSFFMNCIIPHTVSNLLQTISVNQNAKEINLLDTRIVKARYGQTIADQLSNYVQFEDVAKR